MTQSIYVVQRKALESRDVFQVDQCEYNLTVPTKAFVMRSEAEKVKRKLEESARKEICPFALAEGLEDDYQERTSLSAEQILQKLGEWNIPKPKARKSHGYKYYEWTKWWHQVVDQLSDEQREAVWSIFDKVEFYKIAECDLED